VDTGQPILEAINNHAPEANRAAIMPKTNTSGWLINWVVSIIPLLMVSVTSPPAKYAPAASKIIAIIIACLGVMVPEPTDVPIAFETSLAPTPKAMKKPKTAVIIINNEPY